MEQQKFGYGGEKLKGSMISPLFKKFGIVAIALGIILAIVILKVYFGSIHTMNKVSKRSVRWCEVSSDCVICNNECISASAAPAFCSNPTYGNCGCINHTCQKV